MTRLGKEQEAAAIIAACERDLAKAMALLPRDPDAHQIRGQVLAGKLVLADSVRKINHRTGKVTDAAALRRAVHAKESE